MQVSELTLKLILILIPGAVSTIIYEKLTIQDNKSALRFVASTIFFGAISYIAAQFFCEYILYVSDDSLNRFWDNIGEKDIPYPAIWKSCISAVFIGFAASAFEYYKIINRVGKLLRFSNKWGDENLYQYFFNAEKVDEVYIRDFEKEVTYHGKVKSYLETVDTFEVVLSEVSVYSFTSEKPLYEIDKLYLSRPKNDMSIEVPYIEAPPVDYRENV